MNESEFLCLKNGTAAQLTQLPLLPFSQFREQLLAHAEKYRISAFFAWRQRLVAVLADDGEGRLLLCSSNAPEQYHSLTSDCAAFHLFEREIYENTGILPEGHPWLKPVRFLNGEAAITDYWTLQGSGTHEVAVGPVHAGVIEPGHFRFQCLGEDVHSLEISLGFQHRGIEKMLVGGPDQRTAHLMEVVAGDSSTAYAGGYSSILCALDAQAVISQRAEDVRLIAWELERIANHVGDLGALAGDVAFLPTASYCGRIRGDFLNMTASICGNRFGRSFVTPGGIGWRISESLAEQLMKSLEENQRDLKNALDLMFDEPTVLDRFENTGVVSKKTGIEIGLVGIAARACGLARDVRASHPYGAYRRFAVTPACGEGGDVLARAIVRRRELDCSLKLVSQALKMLPDQEQGREPEKLAASSIAVSLSEGWRGEICQVAITDDNGRFDAYKLVDPSFHNWFGLAMALRNEQISNFPICNKSFNLSYCGHDL